MTHDAPPLRGDPDCTYKFLEAKIAPSIDPTAMVDVACFMTTDTVDADNEVVLPSGVDLSRFEKNPVLMLCHAHGQPGSYYPLPIGKVIWTKKRPNGVMAGIAFARSTGMGREVKSLFDEDMCRSFSIGFRSIESSLMTREESRSRPDWKAAYGRTNGRVLVHRKWLLVELSVAPIPSNEDALRARYAAKGLPVPNWINLTPAHEATMNDLSPPESGPAGAALATTLPKPSATGSGDSPIAERDTVGWTRQEPEQAKCMTGRQDPAADDHAIQPHDYVKITAPHHQGYGLVKSVHDSEMVPDVVDDLLGTKANPAARVECYKAMGDGFVPTDHHVGHYCKHLEPIAPLRSPSKSQRKPQGKSLADEGPLPPLVGLSEQDAFEDAIARLNQLLKPEAIRDMVAEELEHRMGYV